MIYNIIFLLFFTLNAQDRGYELEFSNERMRVEFENLSPAQQELTSTPANREARENFIKL